MLDADTFKRLRDFDVWEDDNPDSEIFSNPNLTRRSEEKIAAPKTDVPEKQKSAA
jgi:hypothetical protein